MYRFTRTAVIKTGADTPKAIEFTTKVVGFLKEKYEIQLHAGVELFGQQRLHWTYEAQTLDSISELNGKLLKDEVYIGLLNEYSRHWIDGSVNDSIIRLITAG